MQNDDDDGVQSYDVVLVVMVGMEDGMQDDR
jgi:hypothetical protein